MSAKVEDKTSEYIIAHHASTTPPDLASLRWPTQFEAVHWRDGFDEEQRALRESIWALKTKLDAIDIKVYTEIRNRIFPLARSGEQHHFSNRAGHKLMQSMQACGVWEHLQATQKPSSLKRARKGKRPAPTRKRDVVAFADICGGPGAFAQALLAQCKYYHLHMKGYGITLAGVDGLDWYPELLRRGFSATYGIDGTGDIFKLANLEALASLTAQSSLLLAVADGGFNVGFDVANYQETISTRITFGQWLAALKVLRPSGSFVLKLFDTFSPNSRALLFLSTFMYERVHVVKPKHSRVVNSERYLVCVNLLAIPDGWMDFFDTYYEKGFPDSDHSALLIPPSLMTDDACFTAGTNAMNESIAARQKVALQMILDEAAAPSRAAEKEATATATSEVLSAEPTPS